MERIVGGDLLTLFTWRRFCSLPVGHNIGILEFFGSDLHLDFCTRGCPTPDSLSQSLQPDLSTLLLAYSSRCLWKSMWSTQSGFHPLCPTLAGIQWIGSRPVTSNSLCRFCAAPTVWPICSPENSLDVLAKAALNPIIRP